MSVSLQGFSVLQSPVSVRGASTPRPGKRQYNQRYCYRSKQCLLLMYDHHHHQILKERPKLFNCHLLYILCDCVKPQIHLKKKKKKLKNIIIFSIT